jgi:hypothetical protein
MSNRWKAALAAYLFISGMRSLQQDMLGMENYITMIRAGWLSPWFTVPLALLSLLCAVMIWKETK